jgi:hypothetical protein
MVRNPDTLRESQKNQALRSLQHWQKVLNNILAAALVASLIFLAERVLIQLISINYHRKQFNSKIKDSKRNVHLLSLLYDASRAMFPAYCDEFREEDYAISDSIALPIAGKSQNGSGTTTPLKIFQEAGRFGGKITAGS